MKKIIGCAALVVSSLSFASMTQSVEQSMDKVAGAANQGVSKMVHGARNMASKTEQMGSRAAQGMEKRMESMRHPKTADAQPQQPQKQEQKAEKKA